MAYEIPHLPTVTAERAFALSEAKHHPSLHAHSVRSWIFASALGTAHGVQVDSELLAVAALLHDLGLATPLDSADEAFEVVGGSVAGVFAIGAGWDEDRRRRLAEIIERHMWPSVDLEFDTEGHLLEAATSLDVGGVDLETWDRALLSEVLRQLPRGDFAETFASLIARQADHQPASPAARLHGSGAIGAGERAWLAAFRDR